MKIDEIKCPICDKSIHVDVFEYDSETGIPTAAGFHTSCNETPFEDNCNRTYEQNLVLDAKAFIFMKKNNITFNL